MDLDSYFWSKYVVFLKRTTNNLAQDGGKLSGASAVACSFTKIYNDDIRMNHIENENCLVKGT